MYAQSQHIAQVIARTLALAGGGALIVLIVLTCLSIIGRVFVPLDIGIGPIRGIYDITEIGISAAVFAFLPLAQLRETHARVDLFQWAIPRRINQGLDLLFNLAKHLSPQSGPIGFTWVCRTKSPMARRRLLRRFPFGRAMHWP